MSLLINPLLLATLAAIMAISSTQDQGQIQTNSPHPHIIPPPLVTTSRPWVLSTCRGAERRRWKGWGKGDTGPPGAQGEKGMAGPRGPVGEKGAQGHPGVQGDQEQPGVQGPPTGGAVYMPWGQTTCPTGQGTQLLYAGRAGGTHWDHSGGAANFVCLPNDPDHLQYQSGVQGYAHIEGVEYRYAGLPSLSSSNHHNAPCAVYYVATRSVAVMIPAKTRCPTNWTLEYIGYLMAKRLTHAGRSMYECVDRDPESVPGLNVYSAPLSHFYIVEPYCNGLSCAPYDDEKELTCVVCTR